MNALAATGALAAGAKVDPAFFGSLPDTVEIQISPDGKTTASLQAVNGDGIVLFRSVDDPDARPTGVRIGATDARTIVWADNDRVLLLLSQSKKERLTTGLKTIEYFRWMSIHKSTSQWKLLFANEGDYVISDPGAFLAMVPGVEGKALFSRTTTRGQTQRQQTGTRIQGSNLTYSLLAVDLDTGSFTAKQQASDNTYDWIADSDGEAYARVDYNSNLRQRELYVKRRGSNTFSMIKAFPDEAGSRSVITFHGLIGEDETLAATTYTNGVKSLVAFDVASASISKPIFASPTYDIDSVTYDPRAARATAAHYIDDLPHTFHFDDAYAKLQEELKAALPGAAPMIVSSSSDGQRMIVEAIYTDHPKQFFLFDRAAKRLDMIAASYERLDGAVFANKEKYDYVSADGLKIPGYLTVPEGASKQNMPLIVLPHGGPESRSDQSFDYWSFFYASRGYLVYEPNFRGSDGYGYDFRSAGFGEWGRKMQDDITQGVKKLISDGIADSDRICIVGASYGGYAALAGATLTPDMYACAVSINGVSNLAAMLGEQARRGSSSEDYWEVRIGASRFNTRELNEISPARISDRAGAPILIIHAKDDTVVPIGQSRQMRDALKSAGKPHEYKELNGEDHWLSTGETRTEMLRLSIDFIDKHIGE